MPVGPAFLQHPWKSRFWKRAALANWNAACPAPLGEVVLQLPRESRFGKGATLASLRAACPVPLHCVVLQAAASPGVAILGKGQSRQF